MTGTGPLNTAARTDKDDNLVSAEEPLAALQMRCGGEIPGPIAIPELRELVTKARTRRLKLSNSIHAIDGDERVSAWVDVIPNSGAGTGCNLQLAAWQSVPIIEASEQDVSDRNIAIVRQAAEVTARLDAEQNTLTADGSATDARNLVRTLAENLGKPWTEFVEVAGNSHEQPMHWRLLNGALVRFEGSQRNWRATLVPLGNPEPGRDGFELYLTAEELLADAPIMAEAVNGAAVAIGREVAPVLRQPIARIIANAETIRSKLAGPLAEEYSNYAADIAAAGEHLLALVDDLSDLEVVEAESFSTAPDRIDLGDVARRAAGILGVRAKEKSITLVAPQESELLPATGEFRRVLQVLLNLVGNAINYSPEGSQIWLRMEEVGAKVTITVADQGQGLSREQQARVFEKFERLGRGGDGGSGLGLYISRKLARAMGGDLVVESEPGKGARFTLTLPGPEEL
ncbi:HAMP domain-containing sensor histidine kinase [Altererythrobacter sp. ZODW24]|uniref:sensor histidine kinase n=1 Tax=Altererythrobacter sp. ZODW24 TaxID=2185142 RepID=UPI000DF7D2DC|nr:HAMP domain-containing sensor histidine kinase [Altererythrobacter sp. ZODW24]